MPMYLYHINSLKGVNELVYNSVKICVKRFLFSLCIVNVLQ